jgi:N-acetylglucosamine kinase-like BadF-type ATPase
MSRLYLGIDGGQSSTKALIATESGRIIGHGRAGPCNHVRTCQGRAKFFEAVSGSLKAACNQAGIDANTVTFAAVCLGFSGGPEDKEAYSRELIRSANYKITHDAEIALTGATAGRPGIITIAGTGSMVFGRNAARKTARAGGWGYIFGDEGGAFDLTRRALRAALQFEEGWGRPTVLRALLLESTGAQDANDLLHRFYTAEYTRTRIARLAPLVTQAAEQGDEVGSEILNRAAEELAAYVKGVHQQLFQWGEDLSVAYAGGVFQSDPLLNCFSERVRRSIGCEVCPPRLEPVAGAVLEALRLDENQSELSDLPKSET